MTKVTSLRQPNKMNPKIFIKKVDKNEEIWARYLLFKNDKEFEERFKKIGISNYTDDAIKSVIKLISYVKKYFEKNKVIEIILEDDVFFNAFKKDIHILNKQLLYSMESMLGDRDYILIDKSKKNRINLKMQIERTKKNSKTIIRRGEKEIHYTQNEIFQDILHFIEFEKKLIYKKAIYFTYLIKQACKYINSETINENFESFLKESSNEYLEYLKKGFNKKDLDKKIKKISNTKKGSNSNNKKDNNTLIYEVFKEGCNEISGCDKSIEFLLKLISKENSSLDDDIYFVFLIRKLRKQRRVAKIRQEKILKCMQQKINNTETQKDKINLAFIENLIINSNKRNCEFKSLVANIFNNQLSIIDQINKRHENLKYSPRILQNNLNTYVQNIA